MVPKLFVFGLDGATLDLMKPFMTEGLLPNFQRLCTEGVYGGLASTIHPLSPPAWTSFITGKNPGKHGIYDFVIHKPHSYELEYTYGGMRHGDSIWKLLSQVGKRVVVLNVPMTYPPEQVNGVLIAGFDAPGKDSDFTYPSAILSEITRHVGPYRLRDYPQGHDPASFLRQIEELIRFRRRLTLYMMDHHPWDFFMVVFGETDLAQHAYWHYMDPAFTSVSSSDRARYGGVIRDIYIEMDAILGDVLSRLPDDATVLVMSDHGAGPCYKAVFINKWLEQNGLLAYVNSKPTGLGLGFLKRMHHTIKTTVPPTGLEWMKRTFPRLRQKVKSAIVFSDIDWTTTKVWSFGRESTNLFINVRGKFPHGIVHPGSEYEKLRTGLIEALQTIQDPDTGEPAVSGVYRVEDVYHGQCMDHAPDLLVVWRNHEYTAWPGYDDRHRSLFESSLNHSDYSDWSRLQKGGNHRPHGILFAKGPGIRRRRLIQGARIIDLAPTVLYLMGAPIPEDMDGRILETVIRPSRFREDPPHYAKTPEHGKDRVGEHPYSAEEAARVEERLRNLGYIE